MHYRATTGKHHAGPSESSQARIFAHQPKRSRKSGCRVQPRLQEEAIDGGTERIVSKETRLRYGILAKGKHDIWALPYVLGTKVGVVRLGLRTAEGADTKPY